MDSQMLACTEVGNDVEVATSDSNNKTDDEVGKAVQSLLRNQLVDSQVSSNAEYVMCPEFTITYVDSKDAIKVRAAADDDPLASCQVIYYVY